jgi:hypothetical protein
MRLFKVMHFRKNSERKRTPAEEPALNAAVLALASVVSLAAIGGCGPGNPLGRQCVNGQVSLDGVPLDQGAIYFAPQSANGVSSGAVVKDGYYSISAEKGLPPGKYQVKIMSTLPNPNDRKPEVPGSGSIGLPGISRIAAKYNSLSKITVEVVFGQEARFDFDTKSK